MGAVNVIVIVESIRALISQEDSNEFQVASIAAVAAALGVKFLLFLYCYSLRKVSSQVEVLWEDHRNDLFINSFGVLMSAGGSKLRWCKLDLDEHFLTAHSFSGLDPMGAILVRRMLLIRVPNLMTS
jgi:divalent metal cation (Fe/Co/Zn/Cd) transporter